MERPASWGVATTVTARSRWNSSCRWRLPGVEDLLAVPWAQQPILTSLDGASMKVQLPSNYATLLRLD